MIEATITDAIQHARPVSSLRKLGEALLRNA